MNSLLGTPLSRLGSLARDPEGRMQLGRMASLGTIPAGEPSFAVRVANLV